MAKKMYRPERKVCRICGREFPNTHEYFEWSHRELNYLQTFCRECSVKRSREKYERMMQDPEKYEAYKERARQKELEKLRAAGVQEKQEKTEYATTPYAIRQREKLHNDPVFAEVAKIRRAVRSCVLSQGKNNITTSKYAEIVGMPMRDLHHYLLQTFEDTYGYPWDGVEKTNVDHIVPLCTVETLEDKKKLFHYTNLRLIKARDNHAKGTKLDYQIGARQ